MYVMNRASDLRATQHAANSLTWTDALRLQSLKCQWPRAGGNQPGPCQFVRSGKSALMGEVCGADSR